LNPTFLFTKKTINQSINQAINRNSLTSPKTNKFEAKKPNVVDLLRTVVDAQIINDTKVETEKMSLSLVV
jgi:hypothetical protein